MLGRSLYTFLAPVALALVVAPSMSLAGDDDGYLGDGHIDSGEDESADLARAVQNPIADLISVPFQNNTNRLASSTSRSNRSRRDSACSGRRRPE